MATRKYDTFSFDEQVEAQGLISNIQVLHQYLFGGTHPEFSKFSNSSLAALRQLQTALISMHNETKGVPAVDVWDEVKEYERKLLAYEQLMPHVAGARSFMAGFEDDEMQAGIEEQLDGLDMAVENAENGTPFDPMEALRRWVWIGRAYELDQMDVDELRKEYAKHYNGNKFPGRKRLKKNEYDLIMSCPEDVLRATYPDLIPIDKKDVVE